MWSSDHTCGLPQNSAVAAMPDRLTLPHPLLARGPIRRARRIIKNPLTVRQAWPHGDGAKRKQFSSLRPLAGRMPALQSENHAILRKLRRIGKLGISICVEICYVEAQPSIFGGFALWQPISGSRARDLKLTLAHFFSKSVAQG